MLKIPSLLYNCGFGLKILFHRNHNTVIHTYEGESISNQPNLFPVEIHLFFFDVIAL